MIATTRLRPTAAPHTEIVSRIIGIGICDMVSEVEVNMTSIVNTISIIVSTHIRANIRCLCCIDIAVIVIINIKHKAVFVNPTTVAYKVSSFESKSNIC